jgi:hypothetical protein
VMAASRCPAKQGRMPLLVRHHHRSGGVLISTGLLSSCWSLLVDWCRASSNSNVVAIELQGQLLARERELGSRKGTIAMWEDGLAAFELERCTQNVMPVVSEPRLSRRTSLPRCVPLAPCPNSSSASTRRWRKIRSSFASRRRTRARGDTSGGSCA